MSCHSVDTLRHFVEPAEETGDKAWEGKESLGDKGMVGNENGIKEKEKAIYRLPTQEPSVVSAVAFLTYFLTIKNTEHEKGQR